MILSSARNAKGNGHGEEYEALLECVASRRRKILERLDSELGLKTREERDELRATLPDLPPKLWPGRQLP